MLDACALYIGTLSSLLTACRLQIDAKYHGSPALQKGESWVIQPKTKWIGGRVWARTGCAGEGKVYTVVYKPI